MKRTCDNCEYKFNCVSANEAPYPCHAWALMEVEPKRIAEILRNFVDYIYDSDSAELYHIFKDDLNVTEEEMVWIGLDWLTPQE